MPKPQKKKRRRSRACQSNLLVPGFGIAFSYRRQCEVNIPRMSGPKKTKKNGKVKISVAGLLGPNFTNTQTGKFILQETLGTTGNPPQALLAAMFLKCDLPFELCCELCLPRLQSIGSHWISVIMARKESFDKRPLGENFTYWASRCNSVLVPPA